MGKTTPEQQPSKLALFIPYAGMVVGALFLGVLAYAVYKLSNIRRITIDIEQE